MFCDACLTFHSEQLHKKPAAKAFGISGERVRRLSPKPPSRNTEAGEQITRGCGGLIVGGM